MIDYRTHSGRQDKQVWASRTQEFERHLKAPDYKKLNYSQDTRTALAILMGRPDRNPIKKLRKIEKATIKKSQQSLVSQSD
tara:strand:- start:1048 stop:1290 length:243 start_codon:yes stop_codon:yes gene_type:complete